MDWIKSVDEFSKDAAPLSKEDLLEVNSFLSAPLSSSELKELKDFCAKAGKVDCTTWKIPTIALPDEYKNLLAFSDGLSLINGERECSFFGKQDLREYYLYYQFPEYLPEALPIGLNGGGVFYAYDLRNQCDGEAPIIAVNSGAFSWDETIVLGHSLEEVFSKRTNIEEELFGPDIEPPAPLKGDIWLLSQPQEGLKGILSIKKFLKLSYSPREMKSILNVELPYLILKNGNPLALLNRQKENEDILRLLGFSEVDETDVIPYSEIL